MAIALTVDILSTFCDVFVVQYVKLTLIKFLHLWFSLFDCRFCSQNVTCLKRFTRYGHYAGEVEDIVTARLAVVRYITEPKIRAFSCGFTMQFVF